MRSMTYAHTRRDTLNDTATTPDTLPSPARPVSGDAARAADETKHPASFWADEAIAAALDSFDFGALLCAFRQHPAHGRRISQKALAARLGLHQRQLSDLETGQTRPIKVARLVAWADAIGLPEPLRWFANRPLTDVRPDGRAEQIARLYRAADRAAEAVVLSHANRWSAWLHADHDKPPHPTINNPVPGAKTEAEAESELGAAPAPEPGAEPGIEPGIESGAVVVPGSGTFAGAAGATFALLGVLNVRLARYEMARQQLARALGWARRSDDPSLTAFALGCMADSYTDADQALRCLRAAEAAVATVHDARLIRSWAAARIGVLTARIGQREAAIRAVERSWIAYQYADADTPRPWLAGYGRRHLAAYTVATYHYLQHPKLDPALSDAIATFGQATTISGAHAALDIVNAGIHAGRPDDVLPLLHQAERIATATRAVDLTRRLPERPSERPSDQPQQASHAAIPHPHEDTDDTEDALDDVSDVRLTDRGNADHRAPPRAGPPATNRTAEHLESPDPSKSPDSSLGIDDSSGMDSSQGLDSPGGPESHGSGLATGDHWDRSTS